MLLSALDLNLLTPIFFVRLYYNGSPYIQYCGGIRAVQAGDSFSTVGDTFSTVEAV